MILPILGQGLSFLAMALFAASYQVKRQRPLLAVQTAATLSKCLSYLFLGASTGFVMNILSIVRNLTYAALARYPRLTVGLGGVLAVGMCVLGAMSWQGPVSLLLIVALAINTLCMSFGRPQLLRASVLLTSSLIFVHDVCVGSVGGALSEALSVVSAAVGLVRFLRTERRAPSPIPEDGTAA